MIEKLEQQLTQDGKSIKDLAQSRLAGLDLNQSLMASIALEQAGEKKSLAKAWWYGVAAAISLSVMVWTFSSMDSIQSNQPIKTDLPDFSLQQLPLSLEKTINQPLMNEQQAIIADLKALKKQLLSI